MSYESKAYADFADDSFSWRYIERPAIDRAIPDALYRSGIKILDIGCGSGRVIDYHIKRGAPEQDIVGIEPDPTLLDISRRRFPQASFLERRIQDAPLDQAVFNLVTAQLVLGNLSNSELCQLMRRLHDTLAPNGLLYILDDHPVRHGIRDGFEHYFEEGPRLVDTPWGGKEKHHYRTIASYVAVVLAAGLTLVSLDECPITSAKTPPRSADYDRYGDAPVRFAILAKKVASIEKISLPF